MAELDYGETDVLFIGTIDGKYRMTWDKFRDKANFVYDNGYGSQIIAHDLIVYFCDGTFLERAEYDGSEWWEYRGLLSYVGGSQDFDILGLDEWHYGSVEEINNFVKSR